MDRKRIPSSQSSNNSPRHRKKAPPGLQVIERGGFWHINGTIRIKGRSRRIRKSTELPATPENFDDANAVRLQFEQEARDEVIYGIKPTVSFAVAADTYLSAKRKRPLGQTSINIIRELTAKFLLRPIRDIPDREWTSFIDARHVNNSSSTRERYINTVLAFTNWCCKKPRQWMSESPTFDRDGEARNPNRRARRRVHDLSPEIVAKLIEAASPHLKGVLAVEWSTGARVSSILHGCRVCDVNLTTGSEQITFHDTKNGTAVNAALHPWAAEQIRLYLEWRGDDQDREAPLFLTHKRKPYSSSGRTSGTQNKTAFNAAKRRAAVLLRREAASTAYELWRQGRKKDARKIISSARENALLLSKVTQHWFRHWLATHMLAATGDIRSAMDQGGWLDPRSVVGYTHDVPERRRSIIEKLSIGDTRLTQEIKSVKK